jgi:PIN domain nuclease of toxin-antitoxin system
MNLLLDTHALIWWLEGSKRLGSGAKKALGFPGVRPPYTVASAGSTETTRPNLRRVHLT